MQVSVVCASVEGPVMGLTTVNFTPDPAVDPNPAWAAGHPGAMIGMSIAPTAADEFEADERYTLTIEAVTT